jgi:hypothetical protein
MGATSPIPGGSSSGTQNPWSSPFGDWGSSQQPTSGGLSPDLQQQAQTWATQNGITPGNFNLTPALQQQAQGWMQQNGMGPQVGSYQWGQTPTTAAPHLQLLYPRRWAVRSRHSFLLARVAALQLPHPRAAGSRGRLDPG